MTEQAQRNEVVAEARRWIGTPYHHQADVLGAGVDCGMLLVRVYVDTGVVPPFDPRPYPVQWHLHRDDERYLGFLIERGVEVEAPAPGDIVVWKIGRAFAHGGIVTAWPLERDGRKEFSGVALFSADGELLARGHQVWIVMSAPAVNPAKTEAVAS